MSKWNLYSHLNNPWKRDGTCWVSIVTQIRNNRTGEIVLIEDEAIFNLEENEVSTWIWEEGNFACDCNRGLFFFRSKGLPYDGGCGHDSFSVNLINPVDGQVFFREFQEPQEASFSV